MLEPRGPYITAVDYGQRGDRAVFQVWKQTSDGFFLVDEGTLDTTLYGDGPRPEPFLILDSTPPDESSRRYWAKLDKLDVRDLEWAEEPVLWPHYMSVAVELQANDLSHRAGWGHPYWVQSLPAYPFVPLSERTELSPYTSFISPKDIWTPRHSPYPHSALANLRRVIDRYFPSKE